MFDSSPENIMRITGLAQERTRLLARLDEIERALKRNLPTLLTGIAVASHGPMTLIDFVKEALRAGYTTKAKAGVRIMVAAGLKMLVEQGVLKRDQENQGYVFAAIEFAGP